MAKRASAGKAGAKKSAKAGKKAGRLKFQAPMNTKTGKIGAAATGGKDPVNPSEVMRLTPGTTLKSLLSTCRGYKKNVDSIVGKMREEIAYAKDKKGLNTSMFALLRRFDKMEPEEAAANWHTLVGYMESSGVMAKIESAADQLPLGEPAGEGEGDSGGEQESDESDVAPKDAEAPAADQNGSGIAPADAGGSVARPRFGQRVQTAVN